MCRTTILFNQLSLFPGLLQPMPAGEGGLLTPVDFKEVHKQLDDYLKGE